jgi:proton translocating ATP synthase F1 alpha subunit
MMMLQEKKFIKTFNLNHIGLDYVSSNIANTIHANEEIREANGSTLGELDNPTTYSPSDMVILSGIVADEVAEELEAEHVFERNAGRVITIGDGIVRATGLEDVTSGEIVLFSRGVKGMVLNLEIDSVGIAVLGNDTEVSAGDIVTGTGETLHVPIGFALLGRTLDAMGNFIDGGPEIDDFEKAPVEIKAPGVIYRQPIRESLETGVKVIDALVPIGRGQRELIIGDRQTGKTTIAVDTMLNQTRLSDVNDECPVFCVYVAIGQRVSQTKQIKETLADFAALENSIIVCTGASDAPALQYLAPYTGTTMAEYFRDNGLHSIIIYDDLTKHADAYRQMALLLRRPPGREAYPGDVFYLHSRLLERAAKLSDDVGAGSLTALPIVETQGSDVSAYIPTNVISITDGQIYLESELFYKGIRPAINVGLSVSRVGASAQCKPLRKLSSTLRIDLAQYNQALTFAQFGGEIDEATQYILTRGQVLTELFQQESNKPVSVEKLILSLFTATEGYLDEVNPTKIAEIQESLSKYVEGSTVFAPFLYAITEEFDEESLHSIIDLFFAEHPLYRK